MPSSRGGSTSRQRQRWCASPRPNPVRRASSMRRATPCSAPAIRTATPGLLTRRRPDAALRLVQRDQGRGRADRAVVEPGVGGAAVRRRAQHRSVSDAVQHGRHVLRECAAQRRQDAHRGRPRCRCGMRRGDDGRRRPRDSADRRRRVAPSAATGEVAPALSRHWGSRVRYPRVGLAIPTATPTGSSPTGWTPAARRKR